MIKTKTWILIIGSFFAVSVLAALALRLSPAGGTVANIYRDGVPVCSIDLSLVTEPYEFTLTDGRGSNVIRVEPGRIVVVSADCPDKVCVHQGRVTTAGIPIVCMPHRLVIQIEGDEIDAWS